METTFKLDAKCISSVTNKTKGIKKEILEYFTDNQGITDLLERYVRDELENQGNSDVIDYTIDEDSFTYRNLKGSFYLNVNYWVYFGCDDMNRYEDSGLELSFKINLNDNSVTLSYDELPKREPDQY